MKRKDYQEKFMYAEDPSVLQTKEWWLHWYRVNGDKNNFADADSWFSEMLKCGLLINEKEKEKNDVKKGENNMIINKIISPCICDTRKENGRARAFVKIEYSDGELSLVGVIGPRKTGNSSGGSGQCIDAISEGTPVDGWTSDMLEQLCEIWRTWHLNYLRPNKEVPENVLQWLHSLPESKTLPPWLKL